MFKDIQKTIETAKQVIRKQGGFKLDMRDIRSLLALYPECSFEGLYAIFSLGFLQGMKAAKKEMKAKAARHA